MRRGPQPSRGGGYRTSREVRASPGATSIPGARHRPPPIRTSDTAAPSAEPGLSCLKNAAETEGGGRQSARRGQPLHCHRCHCPSAERTEQVSGYRSAPQGPEPRSPGAAAAPPGTGQPLPPALTGLRDRATAQPCTRTTGFLLLAELLNLRKHEICLSPSFPLDLPFPQGPGALWGGKDHPVPTPSFAAHAQLQHQLDGPGRATSTSAAWIPRDQGSQPASPQQVPAAIDVPTMAHCQTVASKPFVPAGPVLYRALPQPVL